MRRFAFLAPFLLVWGCTMTGPTPLPIGFGPCKADSDCGKGETCQTFAGGSGDGGCTGGTFNICTVTCASDADCSRAGSSARCFMLCDGSSGNCHF